METEPAEEVSCVGCMIGKSGAGKTTLLARLETQEFVEGIASTLGNAEKLFTYNDYTIKILDTAGQEKYDSITNNFFRQGQFAILAFDPSDSDFEEQTKHWYSIAIKYFPISRIIFVATKFDKWANNEELVNKENLEKLINKHLKCKVQHLLMTSSQTGLNLDESYGDQSLLHLISTMIPTLDQPDENYRPIIIGEEKPKSKKNKCCSA